MKWRIFNVCSARGGSAFGGKTFFCAVLLCGVVHGEVAWREPVSFSTVSNTGIGRSLYVVGNQPELGNWQPTGSVRLAVAGGSNWSGRVALRSGAAVEYKFISRVDSSGQHCENTNVVWMGGDNLATSVVARPAAPYAGKTMYYHSSWTSAFVRWSVNGTNFFDTNFDRVGNGRNGGEYLFRAAGFAEEGQPIQFVCAGFLNGTQYWDNAPYAGYGSGDYYTPLDVFFLQDGHVCNYWPPAAPSAPTIITQFVSSSIGGIPGRDVRIYLPRGYTNNAWKRYPVLYMHDGQNIFDPGGPYGTWGAEHSLTREISQGRMREVIVVGVNNNANRLAEYCPPGDSAAGNAGIADAYAGFLVHNVRPAIDGAFRTLNDRANTMTMGSSMGGLVSSWLALRTNVYGAAGVMSPSFWTAPNFRGWIFSNDTKGVRLYLDGGTDEEASLWDHFWPVRGYLMQDGYVERGDLLTFLGCGQIHNEAAWAARTPVALRFLLDLWDEPNRLSKTEYPPRLEWEGATGVVHRTLSGFRYRLETTSNAVEGAWQPVQTSAVHQLPWSSQRWTTVQSEKIALFRAVAEAP
ncbi:MAG TPA: alpha/beta hydrolase-fold protein [Kiritimatiellia bacterium]|nr:alpha/beta hydrolase-fold protein [Kiritimatiellia bacterium]